MPAKTRAERASARDARAKDARAFINRTVPALLRGNPRARAGVEAAERIVDPPPWTPPSPVLATTTLPPTGAAVETQAEMAPGGQQQRERHDAHRRAASHGPGSHHQPARMRISLRAVDTLEAAARLVAAAAVSTRQRQRQRQRRKDEAQQGRVAVLNMASPLRPGGGVLTGATSQEERLCARTTLYPSLRESFYRLPDVGGVYTPDVLVCRSWGGGDGDGDGGGRGAADEMLPLSERFYVDVLTAAMLRMPDTTAGAATASASASPHRGEAVYADPRDRELARRQMRAALRILRGRGVSRIVLGAWGCGAYGNPVGEVARAWRSVLLGSGNSSGSSSGGGAEGWDGLQVVFAVRDAGMARAFADAFGPDLVVEEEQQQQQQHQGGNSCDEDHGSPDGMSAGSKEDRDEHTGDEEE